MARAVALAEAAREAPLPASLAGWADLRARLNSAPPEPARGGAPGRALRFAVPALAAVCATAWLLFAHIGRSVSPPRTAGPEIVKAHPTTGPAATGSSGRLGNASADHTNSKLATRLMVPMNSASGGRVAEGHTPRTSRTAKEFIPSPTEGREYPLAGAKEFIPSQLPGRVTNGGLSSPNDRRTAVGIVPPTEHHGAIGLLFRAAHGNSPNGRHPSLGAGREPVQRAMPELQTARAAESELAYLNPDPEASLTPWTQRPPDEVRLLQQALERQVKGGDSFITIPPPQIAGRGPGAVQAALAAQEREAAIVDARLVRTVALRLKAVSFADLCEKLTAETGIQFSADRCVADDKLTLFCHPRSLRSIMRQVAQHFGFGWLRQGGDGAYEYELTQTLRSQLIEEGLRQKDQEEMLLAIDRQMEAYRKYRGMSLAQIAAVPKTKDNFQSLFQLESGGIVPMNRFFGLSRAESDALRAGQTLSQDLMGRDTAGLPPAVTPGAWHAFDASYARERKAIQERGGDASYIPTAPTRLTASLMLDRSTPGKIALKGDLSDQQTGLGTNLAVANSPAFTVENAKANARLASDPELQRDLSLKLTATCRLDRTPYPDTDSIYEAVGDKVVSADVLEALFDATGIDVLGDSFSHLYSPAALSVSRRRLFTALNRMGDGMRMRWTKAGDRKEAWLQFRTSTFYYDRPQEIPNRLLDRWKALRQRQGVMTPEDLSEVGQLPDAQLDSVWMSRAAIARWGLQEYQIGRIAQLRPHWRLLARLPDAQRREVWTGKGLSYGELSADLQGRFLALAYDNDPDRPGRHQVRGGSLRGHYLFSTHPVQYGGSYKVLETNPLLFVYTTETAEERGRMAIVGPWNSMYGMSPGMLEPDAYSIVPGQSAR